MDLGIQTESDDFQTVFEDFPGYWIRGIKIGFAKPEQIIPSFAW